MRTRINGVNVTHINSETGEVICKTNGCTEIHDGTLTEKRKKGWNILPRMICTSTKILDL